MALFTAIAATAAIASAFFSQQASRLSQNALVQQRESLLLAQRLEACAEITERADALVEASREANHSINVLRPSALDYYPAVNRVREAQNELERAYVFDILGPQNLEQAESEVRAASMALLSSYPTTREEFRVDPAEIAGADLWRTAYQLRRACARAAGVYRDGPEELEPPLVLPPQLRTSTP